MIHFLMRDEQDTAARLMSYRTAAGLELHGWMLSQGCPVTIASRCELPAGSTIALRDLVPGDHVTVLGRELGRMTASVRVGELIPAGAWSSRSTESRRAAARRIFHV